jgi:hypothetical protein
VIYIINLKNVGLLYAQVVQVGNFKSLAPHHFRVFSWSEPQMPQCKDDIESAIKDISIQISARK